MEKRYEEALERARQGLPIDKIFPELYESEEERIRKNCIHFLELQKAHHADTSEIDDCIAYLDRQNEQKPAEWSEDYREEDLRTRFAFYTYKDEDDVLYLSNVFVEETSRNKGFGTKILAAAEKVAETIGAINIRLKVKQNSPANAWYRKHGYGYMAFEGDYDWLEKTLEFLKPVKQEWSEDGERKLNRIYEILGHAADDKGFLASKRIIGDKEAIELQDFLKSLRPQPRQEWSEEDEEMLNSCISSIEESKENRYAYRENDGDTSYDREIDWLKSIRPQPRRKDTYYDIIHNILDTIKDMDFMSITPEHRVSLLNDIRVKCKNADECAAILDEPHWKPSEEQMEALKETAEWKRYSNPQLFSLYEDLKAL